MRVHAEKQINKTKLLLVFTKIFCYTYICIHAGVFYSKTDFPPTSPHPTLQQPTAKLQKHKSGLFVVFFMTLLQQNIHRIHSTNETENIRLLQKQKIQIEFN